MRVFSKRLLYWIADRAWVINIVASLMTLAQRLQGEAFAQRLTRVLGWAFTGMFRRPGVGWVNIHASRFYWCVQRRAAGTRPVPSNPPRLLTNRRLRIGVFGYFCGLINFPIALFEGFPAEAELYAFDLQYPPDGRAEWLRTLATEYTLVILEPGTVPPKQWTNSAYRPVIPEVGVSYHHRLQQAATAINQADLDLLMVVSYERHAYDLIDWLETPCIVQACTGSDVLHHPKVSFYLYPQPEAGYFVKGQHLFCAATQAPISAQAAYAASFYYDCRGFDLEAPPPAWSEREPLIVFHGTLYKLAASPVLECILTLLQEDNTVDFAFMGRDDGQLAQIQAIARRRAVGARVHYLGNLSGSVDMQGRIANHPQLASHLKRARLAPDPFPLGGGAARFEAYAAGTPSVHMGVRFDLERGWLRQEGLVELPALLTPSGTAYSRQEYMTLSRRCLYDESFANRLVAEQLAVARKVSDAPAFWRQLIDGYHDWLAHLSVSPPTP